MNKWINIVSQEQPFYNIFEGSAYHKRKIKAIITYPYIFSWKLSGARMDTSQISNLWIGHVAIRLFIFFCHPIVASTGSIQSELFSRNPVSHSWNTKNFHSGKRKKLEEYQISRNVFLCFTHKSEIWAEFIVNSISLLQVASFWVIQKSGSKIIQRLLTFD